jgi:hypothetical protein
MGFEFAVIGALTGIMLGRRYKVLVLVPVIMLSMMLAITIEISRAETLWSTILTTIAAVTAVQLGYLVGAWCLDRRGDDAARPHSTD